MHLLHSRNANYIIVQAQQNLIHTLLKAILPMVFFNTEKAFTLLPKGFFDLGGDITSLMSSPFFCPLHTSF